MNKARTFPRHRHQSSRASGHDRQTSLTSAATSWFAANGFTGTTTKQIAKAAGVSQALLFEHFPTKQALYTAILAEKAQYSELREAVEAATNKRDDERLFTLLASYQIKKGADPTMLRLLLSSALEGHELSTMFF
ncbi:MAG: TetR/AcrR family transcriptional regulator [Nitrospira sp. LK70]|nr:TetR/AcrR family transcriptional regulator [Nitrospira sp. LK70]